VTEAYYFLGAYNPDLVDLYTSIQRHGYILMFREHIQKMTGNKKGNVDTDIVFSIMQKLYKKEKFDNVLLVSGDSDYYRMVKFLIEEKRFAKLLWTILIPSRFARKLPTKIAKQHKQRHQKSTFSLHSDTD
jgi:uncharacterized LabA/DUF88 family protein